jgi:hypothetical protein
MTDIKYSFWESGGTVYVNIAGRKGGSARILEGGNSVVET